MARVGKKLHLVKDEEECYKKISGSVLEYAECLKYFIHRSKIRFFYGVVLSILSLVALYSMPYFVMRMCGIAEGSWIKILSLTVICYMSVTLLPTPGKNVGDTVEMGGLLGSAPVMPVHKESSADFIQRGGRIPAPLHSLRN